MSAICIITARGGSKRIPKKNVRNFLNKPIMAYSIEVALKSELFDEVMVSTDSEEIAQVALQYGAAVPFMRSAETSSDYAGTVDVLKEVLQNYEKMGRFFDLTCCVYPTAPFVTEEKLKAAVEALKMSDADGLTPVVQFSYPPQRAFVMRQGSLVYQYPQYKYSRSQDLEPIYHDCGQFYLYNTAVLMGKKPGSGKVLPLVMPETEVQDIDNYSDWALAEIKYKQFILNRLAKHRDEYNVQALHLALLYIEENLGNRDLSVQSISDHVSLATPYFGSLFYEKFNIHVVEYITRKRIDKARELLLTTNLKINEISQRVGFSSSNYFHNVFKRYTGIPPQKYREQFKIYI